MALELNLQGKTAVITGASEGIGRAIAYQFAKEGINLRLSARRRDKLEEVKENCRKNYGVDVEVYPLDLGKSAGQMELFRQTRDVDILVNNAGAIPKGKIHEIDEAQWRQVWDLKVFGYINLCREYYGFMKDRGDGVIINIIGNGGEKPVSDYIAGSTGNAALMAFTRALGGDSPNDGIRVVGLNPGPVSTEKLVSMMKKAALDKWGDEGRYREFYQPFAFDRVATPEEIAAMAVFLASPLSAYTSGTIVTVDGGMVNKGPLF
ncbi:MAG: short-chain dehydrogenase/reductase [Rhodospirillales bacterium]|jgi:NAD(P)-dependent dehydrogenase (short-subunit alcohol dehydrogenase family)|nr:short-chain dehydrogenase/reductase [Rhodospirillales bacterium]MDP6646330.1 short-chain dehydrogenase/reductase [Rhodospirillales bacterium]|tara:strand:- start:143 stop:931 length:789 start_codon:yes stop_codon:yes gene_type:complete